MTYAISVPTPFQDISELAESFYSRVDEERIMLPNPDAIPEGEWVQFHVTLADGSAALQGQGRCTGSYDNGEDRAPEHRFDVVMDSLQLDEMAQIYFERILQVRAAYEGGEPATGETEVPEEHAPPAAEEAPVEAAPEEHAAEAYAEEAYAEVPADDAADAFGEPAAEVYEEPEAYAEPAAEAYAAEAYAEVPAEEYAEAPAEAYAEVPAEEYAEAPVEEYAEAPVEALEEYAEAAPVEALEEYAEAPVEEIPEALASEELIADSDVAEWEEPSGATEIGNVEDYEIAAAPALETPAESKIYELPPPANPDALPSPHAVAEALTRPVLHASWSPEPLPRDEPSPSSGYFQYAVGAGLPQPAEPPRPELDPSLRVAPAPQPGDPHAAAGFAAEQAQAYAEPEAAYAEDPYAEPEAYAEPEGEPAEAGYAEAGYEAERAEVAYEDAAYAEPEAEYAEATEYEAEAAEVEYAEAAPEGEYAEAAPDGEYDDGAYEDAAYEDAGGEAEPAAEQFADAYAEDHGDEATLDVGAYEEGAAAEETRQVDVSGLPDDVEIGDATMQVEIPEET